LPDLEKGCKDDVNGGDWNATATATAKERVANANEIATTDLLDHDEDDDEEAEEDDDQNPLGRDILPALYCCRS